MFTRKGDCNNCGWCCQFEAVHRCSGVAQDGGHVDPDTRKFYELRGGQISADGRTIRYLMHAYVPCSAHDQERSTCSVYDDRPQICRDFPKTPDQIEGSPCSYWFESEVEGQIIYRGGINSPYPTMPAFDEET